MREHNPAGQPEYLAAPENGANSEQHFTVKDLFPEAGDPAGEKRHNELRNRLVRYFGHNNLWGNQAEDLAQETLMHALQKKDQIKKENVLPWIMAVAHSKLLDFHRRNSKKDTNLKLVSSVENELKHKNLADQNQDINASLLKQESVQQQRHYVNLMLKDNPDFKSVWELYLQQGLTLSEVAKILGVPISTVKSRTFRATEKLRHIIQREKRKQFIKLSVNGNGEGPEKQENALAKKPAPNNRNEVISEEKPVMTVRDFKDPMKNK